MRICINVKRRPKYKNICTCPKVSPEALPAIVPNQWYAQILLGTPVVWPPGLDPGHPWRRLCLSKLPLMTTRGSLGGWRTSCSTQTWRPCTWPCRSAPAFLGCSPDNTKVKHRLTMTSSRKTVLSKTVF